MYGIERIRVDTSVMKEAAREIERAAVQIRMELIKLGGCVKRSENYWIGTAGDGYRKKYSDDEGVLCSLAYRFQEYASLLHTMAKLYEQRETELAEQARVLGTMKTRAGTEINVLQKR